MRLSVNSSIAACFSCKYMVVNLGFIPRLNLLNEKLKEFYQDRIPSSFCTSLSCACASKSRRSPRQETLVHISVQAICFYFANS